VSTAPKLAWRPFQDRPYGEDHYGVPTALGPVDATMHRHVERGWYWTLFGTTAEYLDGEGNQDVIATGRTDTHQQARAAIERALVAIGDPA
jgi:hypothetical protein